MMEKPDPHGPQIQSSSLSSPPMPLSPQQQKIGKSGRIRVYSKKAGVVRSVTILAILSIIAYNTIYPSLRKKDCWRTR